MKNLKINIGDKSIMVELPNGNISISFDEKNSSARNPAPASAVALEWSETLLNGESVNYETAEKAVSALGEGWRIPSRFELESLLDLSRHDPSVDTTKHPSIKSKYYWTSTPFAWNPEAAVWVVNFGGGYVSSYHRDSKACVVAVRSSQ